MYAQVFESPTGKWIQPRSLILPIRLVTAKVNIDGIKTVTKLLTHLVTDFWLGKSCRFQAWKICVKLLVFLMIAEF